MRSTSPVSRPAWVSAVNALTGTGGAARRSPVEIVANATSVVTRSLYAEATGISRGRLGRWTEGVAVLRSDRVEFAAYWAAHNDRVLNLSVSGGMTRAVLGGQLPLLYELGPQPDLVTCGAGVNDILFSAPGTLLADLRALLAAVPQNTVVLDLPLRAGLRGIVGRMSVPYITRINRVIHEVAGERGLRVAEVSGRFVPPWPGKFSVGNFHPSTDGCRDWSRALIEALSAGPAAAVAA